MFELNKNKKILIVGLGMIGGSYAQALTRAGYRVEAVTRNPATIAYALEQGMIADGTTEVTPEVVGRADIIVLAIYPTAMIRWMEQYGSYITPGTLVTDVAGVKGEVVKRISPLVPAGAEFIAAHPMAGRETSGITGADDSVFRGANYIVVPTAENTPDAIRTCEALGRELGFARISTLTPEEHDEIIGFVSQLTHCIAMALMTCNTKEHLEDYTGDSFRDLTRIARLNDEMWSELFLSNRETLAVQIDIFVAEMEKVKQLIENGDRDHLRDMMRASTARRALFDKK